MSTAFLTVLFYFLFSLLKVFCVYPTILSGFCIYSYIASTYITGVLNGFSSVKMSDFIFIIVWIIHSAWSLSKVWYAKQTWYKKVTGELPGEELKMKSYSVHDIAEILQMKPDRVYFHMKKAGVEYILVDQKRRFLKEAFDEWYQSQDRYQNKKAREECAELMEASMTMPEAARALGVTRQTIYNILNNKQNSLKTITVSKARELQFQETRILYNV